MGHCCCKDDSVAQTLAELEKVPPGELEENLKGNSEAVRKSRKGKNSIVDVKRLSSHAETDVAEKVAGSAGASIRVWGAGLDDVNGIYIPNGLFKGKACWMLENGSQIQWSGDKWIISTASPWTPRYQGAGKASIPREGKMDGVEANKLSEATPDPPPLLEYVKYDDDSESEDQRTSMYTSEDRHSKDSPSDSRSDNRTSSQRSGESNQFNRQPSRTNLSGAPPGRAFGSMMIAPNGAPGSRGSVMMNSASSRKSANDDCEINIKVSGAGLEDVNGTYDLNGITKGKPCWMSPNGSQIQWLNDKWCITTPSPWTTRYHGAGSDQAPKEGQMSEVDGSTPKPAPLLEHIDP